MNIYEERLGLYYSLCSKIICKHMNLNHNLPIVRLNSSISISIILDPISSGADGVIFVRSRIRSMIALDSRDVRRLSWPICDLHLIYRTVCLSIWESKISILRSFNRLIVLSVVSEFSFLWSWMSLSLVDNCCNFPSSLPHKFTFTTTEKVQ